jgi:hypothetical protein
MARSPEPGRPGWLFKAVILFAAAARSGAAL